MTKKYEQAGRYALYPNMFGFCGPKGAGREKIYQYLTTKTKVDDRRARKLLEQFSAATAYMKLIAETNDIEDWLDPRVVDAYWIGNDLLNRVRPESLKEMILGLASKGKMVQAAAEEAISHIHYQHRPHHSFHVFVIGGLSGQVERGSVGWELCRIGWGKVLSVGKGSEVSILSRFLKHKGGKFFPELEEREEERLIRRDPAIISRLRSGDLVTFHWGRIVEIIDEDSARRLEYWTERTLNHCCQ